MNNDDILNMSRLQLIKKCKELGITKYSSKNKSQLIELINSKNSKKYTFIEVCAGAGGLSTGLIKSGFTPILLNDNNKDCVETLKHNHPNVNIICESMDKLDYSPYIGKVDLLVGGMPCQSFSQVGQRKGLKDPRGNLMIKFIDIINLINPKIFMMENVRGLLTHDKGNTIKQILENLNKNNLYEINYKILDSSKYDVPQKRERVFIIGVLKSLNVSYKFPKENLNIKTLRDVLYDVPISDGAKYSQEKINLFKLIPQGGCWVNLPQDLRDKYLGKCYYVGGGNRGILHRLSIDKPSPTLLCSPSQKQTERCHPLLERPLTIREYARIQTFDDTYEFIGNLVSQYKQIGNAVPVELSKHLGYSFIEILK